MFLEQFRDKVFALAQQALDKMKGDAPRKTGFMVSKMSISKGSATVLFTITMAAHYTGFVVFGHRTPKGFGYVQGRDFVTPHYIWLLREMGKLFQTIK